MPLSSLFRPARSALAAAALAATALSASAYDRLVVFGDSLSDTGRLYDLSASLNLPGIGAQPSAPYWNGRFSNGPVAVEFLASGLNLNAAQVENYAYGGATSGLLNAHFGSDEINETAYGDATLAATVLAAAEPLRNTGLKSQLAMFQSAHASADPNALYVVWAGSNDFIHADPAVLADPLQRAAYLGGIIQNLTGTVATLYGMGARHFLLPTMPDFGITPSSVDRDAVRPGTAKSFSMLAFGFNQALTGAYGQLGQQLVGEDLHVFDTFAASNAARSAFSNSTQACVGSPSALASDCAGYMFFDDIHPTTATHSILGGQMLAAVPEPATVLLMGLGALALLGHAARRQRRA